MANPFQSTIGGPGAGQPINFTQIGQSDSKGIQEANARLTDMLSVLTERGITGFDPGNVGYFPLVSQGITAQKLSSFSNDQLINLLNEAAEARRRREAEKGGGFGGFLKSFVKSGFGPLAVLGGLAALPAAGAAAGAKAATGTALAGKITAPQFFTTAAGGASTAAKATALFSGTGLLKAASAGVQLAGLLQKPSALQAPNLSASSVFSPKATALLSRTDPEIQEAGRSAAETERLRRGRRATILTSGRGLRDPLGSVSRPAGRAELLG